MMDLVPGARGEKEISFPALRRKEIRVPVVP